MTTKRTALAKKKNTTPDPKSYHLDKRAQSIIAATSGDDDDMLDTGQCAAWLGLSEQWLEIRRSRGGGPPFERISPRCVRYRRGKVKSWLDKRSHLSTSEYA
jgi:predicted DNA-binding transcriptional regulator AlpA